MSDSAKPGSTADLYATERSAKQILCDGDSRYRIPTASQKKAMLVGFAMCGKSIVGTAFDAVRLSREIDLDNPDDIARNMDAITVVEIKSTNRDNVSDDLAGYFFNITSTELLAAQMLKNQYRFAFVHTVRGDWQELSLADVLARTKAIYPAFHIRL